MSSRGDRLPDHTSATLIVATGWELEETVSCSPCTYTVYLSAQERSTSSVRRVRLGGEGGGGREYIDSVALARQLCSSFARSTTLSAPDSPQSETNVSEVLELCSCMVW